MSGHRGDEPLNNVSGRESMDLSVQESEDSKKQASSLPKIFERNQQANTLKKDTSNSSINSHPWLGVDLQKSSKKNLEQVSESIISAEEEDDEE